MLKRAILSSLLLTAAAIPVSAGTITFMASEDAGPVTTVNTGVDSSTIGPFNVGADFRVGSLSGDTNPFLSLPFLLQSNNISVSSNDTSSHTLHLTVLADGLTAPLGPSILLSGFDITGITAGWSVVETTDINGVTLDTTTFLGPLSSGHDAQFAGLNLTAPFTASEHFDITTNGFAGEANAGIALSAVAVPGPMVGAGLPGLLAGLCGMFGFNRFRRRSA